MAGASRRFPLDGGSAIWGRVPQVKARSAVVGSRCISRECELLQLGFAISGPTVSRYLQQLKRHRDDRKAKCWRASLSNHREVIAASISFSVPTLTFSRAVLLL